VNEFSITISPRLYETDAMGHINNATIAAWFEVLRVSFLESIADADGDAEPGKVFDWVVASFKLDFAAETFYGSEVTARVTRVAVGNSSLGIDCEMLQDGKVCVRGESVLVHFDNQAKQKKPIGDELRSRIPSL
jgi:acyl-CoA thioester hydrolase